MCWKRHWNLLTDWTQMIAEERTRRRNNLPMELNRVSHMQLPYGFHTISTHREIRMCVRCNGIETPHWFRSSFLHSLISIRLYSDCTSAQTKSSVGSYVVIITSSTPYPFNPRDDNYTALATAIWNGKSRGSSFVPRLSLFLGNATFKSLPSDWRSGGWRSPFHSFSRVFA